MDTLFENKSSQIIVQQIKEMFEIVIDWETANKYNIQDADGNKIGFAAERSKGIFHKIIRNLLRSHRSIEMDVWDKNNQKVLEAKRPFYFFFSDLVVLGTNGEKIGEIKTRFGILKRKYDLLDKYGKVFGRIESFRFRLWTFTIKDHLDNSKGVISKKWGGVLKEVFSDADRFVIDLSQHNWSDEEKAVLLFACLSIDLDFFEDNSNSALNFFD